MLFRPPRIVWREIGTILERQQRYTNDREVFVIEALDNCRPRLAQVGQREGDTSPKHLEVFYHRGPGEE
jgi:hypothetical protein